MQSVIAYQAGPAADAFDVTFNLRYHDHMARTCTGPCADRGTLTVSKTRLPYHEDARGIGVKRRSPDAMIYLSFTAYVASLHHRSLE